MPEAGEPEQAEAGGETGEAPETTSAQMTTSAGDTDQGKCQKTWQQAGAPRRSTEDVRIQAKLVAGERDLRVEAGRQGAECDTEEGAPGTLRACFDRCGAVLQFAGWGIDTRFSTAGSVCALLLRFCVKWLSVLPFFCLEICTAAEGESHNQDGNIDLAMGTP